MGKLICVIDQKMLLNFRSTGLIKTILYTIPFKSLESVSFVFINLFVKQKNILYFLEKKICVCVWGGGGVIEINSFI